MSLGILMSIHPEWIAKIVSGEKTVEVRKTRPEIAPPFRVFMYQTKPKRGDINEKDGFVVGEFTCDDICKIDRDSIGFCYRWPGRLIYAETPGSAYRDCMTQFSRWSYLKDKTGYGWHIKEVTMYERPMALPEFHRICLQRDLPCALCKHAELNPEDDMLYCEYRVQRAPQSWMYVRGD